MGWQRINIKYARTWRLDTFIYGMARRYRQNCAIYGYEYGHDQYKDFQEVFMMFNELGIQPANSATGSHMVSTTPKGGNAFQSIWFMKVKDPMASATAFGKMSGAMQDFFDKHNVQVSLGQMSSGNNNSETHYVLASFKDYKTFMQVSAEASQSEAFQTWFMETAQDENTRTLSRQALSMWNIPQG